jgi:hypothetical protein
VVDVLQLSVETALVKWEKTKAIVVLIVVDVMLLVVTALVSQEKIA